MAKQHLYSRVPAKVSMYNRSDGFDTFAHSEGLSREFIERELSAVYENKLGKNDAEAVRKGLMPKVYSQCVLRSGDFTQTAITYLPLDYTGERSAYLAHTLILSDEEKESLMHSKNNAIFNPDMFISDISRFDITSASSSADNKYPELEYKPLSAPNAEKLLNRYRPDTVKSFIYAVLAVLCAKGKPVYFKLDYPDAEISGKNLEFISVINSILPYHLRSRLSFSSYITDAAQYPLAKIKGMSEHCPEIHSSKSVFFDFHTDLIVGLPSEEEISSLPIAFFYSLLKNISIRDEFLSFVDNAVKENPALEKTNFKILSDLVFLFLGASGLFEEKEILPNDNKVYDFLCIYEKYRKTLSEEYRRNAYKCLARYPKRHEAIPKNILAKLSRLYPSELDSAKRVAMNSVLELIHTDIMRDKLFTFVKNNYIGEDEATRATIHADLCRVFYGGFLQPQILSFFFEHFLNEPESTQDAVFEKLMLTIRTESIQEKIVDFIRDNYDLLSLKHKRSFYDTFFEMLPECDKLSSLLIDLANAHIANENYEMKEQFASKLITALKSDLRKTEPQLLPLLCKNQGFCRDIVLALILEEQGQKKLYSEYLKFISKKTILEKTEELIQLFSIKANAEEAAYQRVLQSLRQIFAYNGGRASLYDWLEAERMVSSDMVDKKLAEALMDNVIRSAIANSLTDVFNVSLGDSGLETVEEYIKTASYLEGCEQYNILKTFLQLKKAALKNDVKKFFKYLSLLINADVRKNIAEYIKTAILSQKDIGAEQAVLYDIGISVLKNNRLLMDTTYPNCKRLYVKQITDKYGAQTNATKVSAEAAIVAAERLISVIKEACVINPTFLEMLSEDQLPLEMFLANCYSDYGKNADKWIINHLGDAPEALITIMKQSLSRTKPKSKSLFSKIFSKK
ncbi:MAG: hypothetical protein J6K88_01675 [Oscillospiraceae bacterium]|nr:hypothetical protein [Oscillospiraceae bacterium]